MFENLPDNVAIKSRADLKSKLQEGLEDIKNNRGYSLEEVFEAIDKILFEKQTNVCYNIL